ncbi:DUF4988 domain-containing protein, partial [Alistipes sp. OttesenSCG-928-B03]|nr:DUF4988 domain-containing protein [Alistipes sp. OttesenSCG-928-B03]
MKRIFALLMLFALVGFSACSKYDDSDIRQDIEDLDKRVTTLEELTAQLDSKIRNGMLISSVKALTGEKSGWLITFSDNSTIEVEHGLDGANGANGANGTNGIDGKTPYIYTDSEGYWCINYNGAKPETDDESERILDGEGNPITSRGKDGLNGTNGKDGVDGISQYVHIRYSAYENGKDGEDNHCLLLTPNTYIGIVTTDSEDCPEDATAFTWSRIMADNGSGSTTQYMHIMYSATEDGANMTADSDENSYYIGIGTSTSTTPSTNPADYKWSRFRGDGNDGEDGTSWYVHIRYSANINGHQMLASPAADSKYIGLLTNNNPIASSDYRDYKWSRYCGKDGADGDTYYTYVAYSANADGSEMTTDPMADTKYVGFATAKSAPADYTGYTWSQYRGDDGATGAQGPQGVPGNDGTSAYTWIRYADNSNGDGISTSPAGKTYIGVLTTPTNSVPAANTFPWTKFVGDNGATGAQGPQGVAGADGTSAYTWIRYAKDVNGTDMSASPTGMTYIGVLTTPTNVLPAVGEFPWTKFVGDKGETGAQGPQGVPGTSAYTWIRYAKDVNGTDMSASPAGMTYIGVLTTTTNTEPVVGEFVWTKFVGADGATGAQGPQGVTGANGTSAYTWIRYAK